MLDFVGIESPRRCRDLGFRISNLGFTIYSTFLIYSILTYYYALRTRVNTMQNRSKNSPEASVLMRGRITLNTIGLSSSLIRTSESSLYSLTFCIKNHFVLENKSLTPSTCILISEKNVSSFFICGYSNEMLVLPKPECK